MQSFEMSTLLAAPPHRVYGTWLDSRELSALTGSTAYVDPTTGGRFVARDGYVQSHLLNLWPFRQIVQAWRTSDMPCCYADSLLALLFEPNDCCATRLTIQHAQVPDELVERYRRTWQADFLEPMRRYFAEG
jgi:activator of HSP90 ATPase